MAMLIGFISGYLSLSIWACVWMYALCSHPVHLCILASNIISLVYSIMYVLLVYNIKNLEFLSWILQSQAPPLYYFYSFHLM